MRVCPDCGSADVEEVVAFWADANTGKINESGDAPAPDRPDFYCNQCGDTKPALRYVEYRVVIGWGLQGWRETDDDASPPQSYQFDTLEELNAFMLGVEEGAGWLNHEVVYDSREELE